MKCSPFLHSLPRRSPLALCLAVALVGAASASNKTPAANSAHPAFDAPFKAGAPHAAVPHVTTGTLIPVTNCADDGSDGSLRKVIEGAADGDTVDMSGLQCSLITLQSGSLVSAVPNLSIQGPGIDAVTIDGNNADRVLAGQNLNISDVTFAHGIVLAGVGGGCVLANGDLSLTHARLTACIAVNAADAIGGGAVVLGNLTMQESSIDASKASGSGKAAGGGAIVGGTATLYASAVSGNSAEASQDMVYGGGLFGTGTIKLFASTFDSNTAHSQQGRAFGGAIMAAGGVAVHGSIVSNNTAKAEANAVYGGGIHAKGAYPVSILDGSTITGNTAHSDVSWAYGGGISSGTVTAADQVTVTIAQSTISGNIADSGCDSCYVRGGGVHATDSIASTYSTFNDNHATCTNQTSACNAVGGGMAAYGVLMTSKTTLQNVTVSGNSADGGAQGHGIGGGVSAGNGSPLAADNTTIAFNHAGDSGGGFAALPPFAIDSVLTSVIVANNDSAGNPDDISAGPFGMTMTVDGSNNIVMAPAAGVTLPLGTLPNDPMLQPLTTDDGGTRAVHPLGTGSAAIDAGANPDSLGCDQRGYPYRRVYGSSADIGAYEFQGEKHLFADNFDGSPACPPAP